MDFDNLASQRVDTIFTVWTQNLLRNPPEELAGHLASRHCPGTPIKASRLSNGAFNVCYRVTFEKRHRVVVRFTALGRIVARNEKVDDKVTTKEFPGQHTTIPVPKIFGHGKSVHGPYIVMSYIEANLLSRYLKDPTQDKDTLLANISIRVLRRAYHGMAGVLLELSKVESPSELSEKTSLLFQRKHFSDAADYFEKLAQQHFYHLEYQRNDAVADENDCRRKYIARCLFRKLSRDIASEHCNGRFRLYCDDYSPGNVLVDPSKFIVAGVIDWEFSYAAPVEFTYAAPWRLLLERPESWDPDFDQFMAIFLPRFRTFLEVLRNCETEKIKARSLTQSQRLSIAMEQSLDTGLFWISLASRHSALFDEIHWNFIDPKFFGPFTTMEERVALLNAEERANMNAFVNMKLIQKHEATLEIHYSIDGLVDL
ncbi:phosphotransferase enzyme family protein [Penicillium coprophilum]|uniref:phosphotransferase enzyme family protein n=1 Tax=Penicillium coprophilum TaxID=36646 RepID=UPI00238D4F81|nr:phosphotransferase enzyme family protein [Penicillium coprophilum]KAJ5178038.1 phosphotransferase enzyme family protein [Penicillium coprophilum]